MSVRKYRSTKWFKRLADALPFSAPLIIDRTTLAHASIIPEDETSSVDGHHFLTWVYDDYHEGTSQSPAAGHMMRMQRMHDAGDILRCCCEALQLPGTLTDYHHALHLADERLYPTWKAQRTHEGALEILCDADVRLVEGDPSIAALKDVHGIGQLYV